MYKRINDVVSKYKNGKQKCKVHYIMVGHKQYPIMMFPNPCSLVSYGKHVLLTVSQVPGTETATDGINMDVFWSQTVEASILLRGFGKGAKPHIVL